MDDSGGGSGTHGAGGDSAQIFTTTAGGRTRFTAIVRGEVVEERFFDRAFLASGEEEVVVLTWPDGTAQRYVFWGSAECEGPTWPEEVDAGIAPTLAGRSSRSDSEPARTAIAPRGWLPGRVGELR